MIIWVVSDHHLNHANMYKFTTPTGERVRSRFKDADEGDEFMIDAHNAVVRDEDHVWFLGDIAMSRYGVEKVRRFRGHKRLLLGNHDREDVNLYRSVGFQKVRGSNLAQVGGVKVLLTHFPIHPDHLGMKTILNVHGHIHERDSPPGPYRNVSVERINYTPVPLEEVVMEGWQGGR